MTSHLTIDYAAASETGTGRPHNEDSGFAGPRLLAVADGMGGHAHGEVASAAVTGVLAELAERLGELAETEALGMLGVTVAGALRRLTELADRDEQLTSMGCTLTALLWYGTGFALAHVGDSRGYLLRDGVLHQITTDHSLVQSLVDEGRITKEEAANHPRRSMVMRALQAGGAAEPDLSTQIAVPGDRFLLCSDGVTCVVAPDAVRDVLGTANTPADAARQLIAEAKRRQSPDDITCVVADVLVSRTPRSEAVQVVGSAANQPTLVHRPTPNRLTRWTRKLLPH
jgi:protein phosphatase